MQPLVCTLSGMVGQWDQGLRREGGTARLPSSSSINTAVRCTKLLQPNIRQALLLLLCSSVGVLSCSYTSLLMPAHTVQYACSTTFIPCQQLLHASSKYSLPTTFTPRTLRVPFRCRQRRTVAGKLWGASMLGVCGGSIAFHTRWAFCWWT